MSDPRIVTFEELKPVLDVLAKLQWPIPFSEAPHIIERLGWQMVTRNVARSTLPVSLNIVTVGDLSDELTNIEFWLSDPIFDGDEEGSQIIRDAFLRVMAYVSQCLTFTPTGELWGRLGLKWDLPSGGCINMPESDDGITLQVWSREFADIERFEISHGVDPEHNLEDSEWQRVIDNM